VRKTIFFVFYFVTRSNLLLSLLKMLVWSVIFFLVMNG